MPYLQNIIGVAPFTYNRGGQNCLLDQPLAGLDSTLLVESHNKLWYRYNISNYNLQMVPSKALRPYFGHTVVKFHVPKYIEF